MFGLLLFFFFSFLVGFVLYLLNLLLSINILNNSNLTPYESGFSSVGVLQSSFSVHFFVILVMFVIFDLEITLLLISISFTPGGLFIITVLLFFVVGGLYLEWGLGNLKWTV